MAANATCPVALRKKQDEKNLAIIRELLTQSANKYCFECGQRGPTYVNITASTFCCMQCSGLLRGINPPHRVKSISLSSFTDDEIKSLRAGGNEINAKIWLGLYEKKVKFEPRVDDEVRQHLIQKYENRRWYFSPNDLEQQKRLLHEHQQQHQAQKSSTFVASATNDDNSAITTIGQKLGRRDSVKSHQSNQSAPPNLHPKDHRQDPFDLLTGDFPLKSSHTISKLAQPTSGSSLGAVFLTPNTNSQSGTLTPTINRAGSSQQLSQVAVLPNASNQSTFNQFKKNFASNPNVNNRPVPDPFTSSQASFADFDTQFDALKINRPLQPAFPTFSPSVASNNIRSQLPQRPTSTTVQMNVTNKKERRTGIKDDGKPIMSTPTNLPDYSALEELFRGSSQNESSTMGAWSSSTTPTFETANFGKSSTVAGFQNDAFQPQQFHSTSDFTIANDENFQSLSSNNKESSSMADNMGKNWNPFL